MTAFAAIQTDHTSAAAPRGSDLPTCPVCADTMVAAEASAFDSSDNLVSYLWVCETCGYGFVTRHSFKAVQAN
ncbi:MAG TPA: hypothetical protein VNZ94_14085 [Xanthobacteraceae bacterium]|nr:hypothetical protein [Xanthobacteraceae bacterium]